MAVRQLASRKKIQSEAELRTPKMLRIKIATGGHNWWSPRGVKTVNGYPISPIRLISLIYIFRNLLRSSQISDKLRKPQQMNAAWHRKNYAS